VFEILLNVTAGLSWKEALLKVVPKRKGASPKDQNEEEEEENDGEDSSKAAKSNPTQSESSEIGEPESESLAGCNDVGTDAIDRDNVKTDSTQSEIKV